MTELVDITSEVVIPYFIHFAEVGIAPKIVAVEGGEVLRIIAAVGPRLGEMLKAKTRIDTLCGIYAELGRRVGYISKYCIAHGHLHTENVVVEGGIPIIIDWGQAEYLGIAHENEEERYRFWKGVNTQFLMESTQERLAEAGRLGITYNELQEAFYEKFRAELLSPRGVQDEEIQRKAFARYGV